MKESVAAKGKRQTEAEHKTLELNNSPTACGSEKPEQKRVAKKTAAKGGGGGEERKIAKSRKSECERT